MRNILAPHLLAVMALVSALAACGQGGPPGPPPQVAGAPPGHWAESVRRVASEQNADTAGTIAGLWAFADGFRTAIAREGENAVFSPASQGYAFAMLRAAAEGETARQLDKVFGFPDSVHKAFTVLRDDIVTTDDAPPIATPGATRTPGAPSKPPIVAIANGLFVTEGLQLRADYERTLREDYGADAQYVNFAFGQGKEVIDAWVKTQTAGRIDKLFDELAPDTITVLANAVYLKADWAMPFDAARTEDGPFQLTGGGAVRAPMMHFAKPVTLNHTRGQGWQAVELPYAGGELAMWVLVPTGDGLTPPRLSPSVLAAMSRAEPKIVDLTLPRWDIESDIPLLPELAKLGLTDLRNLPAIAPEAYVSDAIHRANITVDESGTEAAAVTGIAIESSLGPQPDVTLRADRPFTFAIVHTPTGAPMFLGTVADPTRTAASTP